MGFNRALSAERRGEIDRAREIGNLALRSAGRIVQELGELGIEELQKNQYGETVLKGDVQAEEMVLNVLKSEKFPIQVVSEEHETTVIDSRPLYLGILDGIDGSGVYKRERTTGRYGTMFAIYKGTDPIYDDYLYGGILEHVSQKLYFANKGRGSWVLENGEQKPIYCTGSTELNDRSRLYADTNFDEVFKTQIVSAFIRQLKEYDIRCVRSSAIHYADLSSGNVDGVIEATRKNNLEIAVAFPLIKEAGGVMFDENGRNLESKKYSEFGQKGHLIVVSAATSSLTNDILNKARG